MVLGYVNARVILTIAFALVLMPLGLIWRLIGRDPLANRRASVARLDDRIRPAIAVADHFTKMY